VVRSLLTFGLVLGLGAGLQADVTPTAAATANVAAPKMPLSAAAALSPSASAAPLSPSAATAPLAPQALSAAAAVNATATASADEPVVPEEVADPMAAASQATVADLRPISSTVLAKLAGALGVDQDSISMDPESGEVVENGGARVDAVALFGELARRLARDEDKDARAALALSIMKKDARAKEAKDLVFEAKLADSVIAQLEGGDKKAKAQLEALAKKGNARARAYLGLDGVPPSLAPVPLSASAAAVPLTTPNAVTATPVPVNPAAVSPAAKP
jgi:hypothetical protein